VQGKAGSIGGTLTVLNSQGVRTHPARNAASEAGQGGTGAERHPAHAQPGAV
jgi:hypothetical protein